MNKNRLEAFSDAIIAIIMTIMVLELKIPEGHEWEDLFNQAPAFFAYAVSFGFITIVWYNHHYLFSAVTWVSKRSYWFNMLWLFMMSLVPVTTGWVGNGINYQPPEYLYFIVNFIFWYGAFFLLCSSLKRDSAAIGNSTAVEKISMMGSYNIYKSPLYVIMVIGGIVGIYYFPPTGLIMTLVIFIANMSRLPKGGDKFFPQKKEETP